MNEEEKQAIERMKRDYELAKSEDAIDIDIFTEDIKTVLNLLEKKDKQIEYMANFINDNTPYTKDTRILENERGVRNTKYTEQYFERKVENGN